MSLTNFTFHLSGYVIFHDLDISTLLFTFLLLGSVFQLFYYYTAHTALLIFLMTPLGRGLSLLGLGLF